MRKLRFKGFSENWQEFELGNIADIFTSSSKSQFVNSNGEFLIVDMGAISSEGKLIPSKRTDYNGDFLNIGDLVMPKDDIGGGLIIGKTAVIDKEKFYVCGDHIYKIKTYENSYFLSYLINSNSVNKYIKSLATGTAQLGLSKNNLVNTLLKLPSLKEQEKIGELFKNLDESINKTELKISKLKQSKKALLDKLFTKTYEIHPQLRFKTFSENWQEFELGNIALIYQPNTISQTNFLSNGYLVYGANGVIGFYDKYNHETEQIAIACRGNSCGVVNLTQAKSWITGNAMVVNVDDFKNINKFFLFTLLKNDKLDYLVSGSGQPQITSDIKIHKVKLPSLKEQEKIGELFKALDESINLYEKKLSKLKQIKLALLEKIFKGE